MEPTTGDRAAILGVRPGMLVQELGWDTDVDEGLRQAVMDAIDDDLVEESVDAVDVVLLWLRDDADVADGLVDALVDLADDGVVWLLTPKIGRAGYVSPAEISEGAKVAGLSPTVTLEVSRDWAAQKLVRPKSARGR